MKLEYVNINGYFVPKLASDALPPAEIGKYGMMRARYLDKHRPFEYDRMMLDGTLAQHLSEIDRETRRQIESLTKKLAEQAGITEELKHQSPLQWAATMQGLRLQAEEIVCAELIYPEENARNGQSFTAE